MAATTSAPAVPPAPVAAPAPSLFDAMGYSGAPELISGRLAMVAFIAAVAAELSSGEIQRHCLCRCWHAPPAFAHYDLTNSPSKNRAQARASSPSCLSSLPACLPSSWPCLPPPSSPS